MQRLATQRSQLQGLIELLGEPVLELFRPQASTGRINGCAVTEQRCRGWCTRLIPARHHRQAQQIGATFAAAGAALLVGVVPDPALAGQQGLGGGGPGCHRWHATGLWRQRQFQLPTGGDQLLGEAGAGHRHLPHRRQGELRRQLRLQTLAHPGGILPFRHLQIQPFTIGLSTERQRQGELHPRQRVEPTGETHRQAAAPQGPLDQAHQIQVAEQGEGAVLAEAEAQALHPRAGGGPLGQGFGDRRGWNHHVVPQLRAAHTTAAAVLKGAVGHHGGRQGPL